MSALLTGGSETLTRGGVGNAEARGGSEAGSCGDAGVDKARGGEAVGTGSGARVGSQSELDDDADRRFGLMKGRGLGTIPAPTPTPKTRDERRVKLGDDGRRGPAAKLIIKGGVASVQGDAGGAETGGCDAEGGRDTTGDDGARGGRATGAEGGVKASGASMLGEGDDRRDSLGK